jgi:hypothetical protein
VRLTTPPHKKTHVEKTSKITNIRDARMEEKSGK